MSKLSNLTIVKAKELLLNKEISAGELVSHYLKVIKDRNKDINAYLEVYDDAASQAEKADEIIAKGGDKPLLGIPLAVKDNILIEGKTCSAGSKMLQNYKAVYDATAVGKLKEAGAIFLGRTNMDEFAMGASTETSAFGPTKNPLDPSRVPGGSSGGIAAAVAMDSCVAALGSDTGGSIRQPAAFCGITGLNPTYGAVSRNGLIAMASSFDQIGPMTKNVEDAEIIFDVIKGRDEMDSTTADERHSKVKERVEKGRIRVGILKYDKNGVDKEINEAMERAAKIFANDLGWEVAEIELPNIKYSVSCYYILVPAEVSSNMARFDGIRYGQFKEGKTLTEDYMKTREIGFGMEVRRRIMLGTYVLSAGYYDAYYAKAQKVRGLIKQDFEKAFTKSGIDLIASPTSPSVAFKIGERINDPLKMYLEDIFTAPAKIAGLPAMSIPSGLKGEGGMPIGLHFTAPAFGEKLLFEAAKKYEHTFPGSKIS
ncbi:Asp-tRNA(Asn)/Glu-tRNA(Gln) amidotransferase subunit GatA [Candidatus Parcubacteria bacterium]|nr:MAG: Asp-tRNA(Asn)/Glu-tRNA(Gln) amidotransferase subunit GatA [Candidatus Parcubacteria bacterium]